MIYVAHKDIVNAIQRKKRGNQVTNLQFFLFLFFHHFDIYIYQCTISEHIYGTIKTLFFMIQIQMANRNDRPFIFWNVFIVRHILDIFDVYLLMCYLWHF